jgi:hypothetical protein
VALQGNSLKFELAQESSELLGIIIQQVKRVKIENYDPVVAKLEVAAEPVPIAKQQ